MHLYICMRTYAYVCVSCPYARLSSIHASLYIAAPPLLAYGFKCFMMCEPVLYEKDHDSAIPESHFSTSCIQCMYVCMYHNTHTYMDA